ncbi:hypothetical protein [Streptomyces sp. NPDC005435]|uniref:hypothetical protein n=1 Tax=Streptomyces sp. NPDC005435 TaxID=3154464 RepID=UPI00345333C7
MSHGTPDAARASTAGVGIGGIALLFVLMIGLVLVVSLIGYLCSCVARRDQLPPGRLPFRAGIALGGCAAVLVYLWGLLYMPSDDAHYLREACAEAGGAERAAGVVGYETGFVPLRFVCRLDGGGGISTIPSWINPTVGALVAVTLILAAAALLTRGPARGRRS